MAQLPELRSNFVLQKDIYENQETRLCYCETKLHNIVLGYLSWGRLFFGIFQASSSFNCKDWWVVLALSLLCTFLYSVLFLDAVTLSSRTQDQLDIICKELAEICQQILVAQNQENVGLAVEAAECSDGFELSFREKMFILDHFRIVGWKVYRSTSLSVLCLLLLLLNYMLASACFATEMDIMLALC